MAGAAMVEEAVTADHVAQVVSRWTGVPVDRMLEGEKEKLLRMEQQIGKRVIGQAEAVKAVSTAVRRARAGPAGPAPADRLVHVPGADRRRQDRAHQGAGGIPVRRRDQRCIRIDMSEYMEKHSVARLIGAPPGYVGYEEGGALTEAVRRRPYQVILFDEIEKAHPDVFNVLLQVLDDGRLTDGQGHTVDFRNTLIVMTSNLGSQFLVEQPEGEDTDAVRRPGDGGGARELPAGIPQPRRRDHPVPSPQAQRDEQDRRHPDARGSAKLLEDRKITIELEPSARDWLADKGWDPAYGARPLKRVIQKAVQDPLAEQILAGHGEGWRHAS